MYRDELEKVIVVIEDKAIDAYKSGYAQGAADRRLQQAHAGRSGRRCRAWPRTKYPKEAELRAGLRAGEPRVRIGKLEEVRRDK